MFFKRSYSSEIMDDLTIRDERIDEALKELRIINKYLGGNSTSSAALKHFMRLKKNGAILKILDLGGGASDILSSFYYPQLRIFNIDINFKVCHFTKKNKPDILVLCGDASNPPFINKSFDIIHASLFMHHFKEEQIISMLKKYVSICTSGIIINDLRRSVIAYSGIKALTVLFSKSAMVKNDGPLSVKRGFVKSELKSLLASAGITKYKIKRKWAFRWLIIISKL